MNNIVEQIEMLREKYGLTKREISKMADITPEYYSKVVHGKCDVSSSVLQALAQAVDCKIMLIVDLSKP